MPLRPAQTQAVKTCGKENKLLIADVGSGKTAVALTILLRKHAVQRKRTLVVSTVRICNIVWPEEIAAWAPGLTYESAAGQIAKARLLALYGDADIVGLNFENLIWACQLLGDDLPKQFPWLIIDEASKLENSDSKSFRALDPLLPLFEWRLPMTGTPRTNHIYNLWGQSFLADLGATFGKYREAFLQKWFYPKARPHGVDWLPKPGSEEQIHDLLRGVSHRMVNEGQVPEVSTQNITVTQPLMVQHYKYRIRQQLEASDTEEVVIDGITFTSEHKLRLGKLLQMSSGYIYDDEGVARYLHHAKLDALKEIVEAAQGESMMIVYQFRHEADLIQATFPEARMLADDGEALTAWNAGELGMLLVHPLSCGFGLNAQFGGALQVWYTPTTDAVHYTQTTGRLSRPGQRAPLVRILRLVMEGTRDKQCYQVVEARQRGEKVTLDFLEME